MLVRYVVETEVVCELTAKVDLIAVTYSVGQWTNLTSTSETRQQAASHV